MRWNSVLQSATLFITNCDRPYKVRWIYYKLREVLQSAMIITNCDSTLNGGTHPRRPTGSQSGREKGRDESFQVRAKEPMGTDSHRTISKNLSGCRLPIGHRKCFVLLYPIGEQFLLSSFREFVHDGYCFNHGLSGSCTKGMHVVRKLSVWYKIPMWFQKTVCPKAKDAFPKTEQVFTLASVTSSDVLRKY